MSTNTAEIKWNSDSSAVERTLESVQRGMEAIARKMDTVEQKSKKMTDTAKGGLADAAGGALNFAGALTGVGSASAGVLMVANALKAEYDELIRRQAETAKTQRGAGEAMREVRKAFQDDRTMTAAQMEDRVADVASRANSSVVTVAPAAQAAFSAKGELTNAEAMSFVETAARLAPNNSGEMTTLAGRYIDVAKATGQKDPRAIAAWLNAVQRGSRIENMQNVGTNAVPAINSLLTVGDSPEQAAEMFNVLNQMMADKEGSQTRTAIVNTANQLQEFLPNLGNTPERVAALQRDAKLREKFFKKASFDAASGNFVKNWLSGDAKARGFQAAAEASTPALDGRMAAQFEQDLRFINGGKFQGLVDAEQGGQAAAEKRALDDRIGGLRGQIRGELERGLTSTHQGFVEEAFGHDYLTMRRHDIRTAAGVNPAEQAANELRRIVGEGALSPADQSFAERQIRAIEALGTKLDALLNENKRQTNELSKGDRSEPTVANPAMAALGRQPLPGDNYR